MLCIGPAELMFCAGVFLKAAGLATSATAGATFCQVAVPHYWSPADTRMTKEQADEHNRIGKRLCNWGKK